MEIEISLHKKQSEAWNLLDKGIIRHLGYGGARGGGKSHLIRARQIYRRLTIPKSRGLIIRKTFPELQRNHIDKIKKEFPNALYEYKAQMHRFEFTNGSILDLTYLRRESDLDNLQGAEYEDICLDEAQQHLPIVREKLRACMRTNIPGVVPQEIDTFNPGGIGHVGLKKDYIDKFIAGALAKDEAFVQALYTDNASLNTEYAQELMRLPEKLRRAWMDGDWTVFEGMFFPEFGEHLLEEPYYIQPHECNLYGSLDYGDGEHEKSGATSFGLWHIDKNGTPHRLFTYYKRNGNASTYAREIMAAIKSFNWTSGVMPKAIYADPSVFVKRTRLDDHTQSVADVFKEYGLNLTQANNDRINGWRVMREYFRLDLTGTPKSYYWADYNQEYADYIPTLVHKSSNPEDVEKGGEDHVGDEARYGLVAFMGLRGEVKKDSKVNIQELYCQQSDINSILDTMSIGDTGI